MAQSGFTPIQLYYSTTPSSTPTAGNLVPGELAINTADGKLFYEDSGGVVQVIATKAGASGDVVGPASATDGNLAAFDGTTGKLIKQAATVTAAQGGTGQSTYTTGDLLYATGASALSKLGIGASTTILTSSGSAPQWTTASSVAIGTATNLAGGTGGSLPYQSGAGATTFLGIGTNGQILTSTGTAPQWSTLSGVAVTTFSAGTTGFTPSTATSGAVTLGGTLATTNGGTGLTSFTANSVVYASSSSALTTGSALTFDGTNLGIGGSLGTNAGRVALTLNATTDTILSFGRGGSLVGYILQDATGQTFYNGENTFQRWYVNATEQMRLTSTGLGIGTSSPGYKLDVSASVTNQAIARLNNSDTNDGNGLYIKAGGVNAGKYALYVEDGSGTALLNLLASGNLGIGTSSPSRKLDVQGAPVGVGGNGTGVLANFVNNTTAFNASPTAAISLWNRFNSGGSTFPSAVVQAGKENATDGNYAGYLSLQTTDAAGTSTERLRLDSSGNLGIGTSSPAYKLVVSNGGAAGIEFGPEFGTNQNLIQSYNRSGASYVNMVYDAAEHRFRIGGVASMRLDASGNLGLGVVPSAWRSVFNAFDIGRACLAGATGSSQFQITANAFQNSAGNWIYKTTDTAVRYEGNGGLHVWHTAPSGTAGAAISFTQAMTLDASGNLGIGTTSITERLTVNGRVQCQWDAYVNGGTTSYSGDATSLVTGSSAGMWAARSDSALLFAIGSTERMRLDASGNLGLGVTPSAWGSGWTASQVRTSHFANISNNYTSIGYNAYESSGWKYIGNNYALLYQQNSTAGAHSWAIAPSGTAGNTISFTQAMTLDASNNLLVGTTSNAAITGFSGSAVGQAIQSANPVLALVDSDDTTNYVTWLANSGGTGYLYTKGAYPFVFGTNGTERARITSGGNFLINNTYATASKLIVGGDGTSNAAFAGVFADSTGATLLSIRNDGYIDTGTRAVSPYNNTTASAANMFVDSAGGLYRSTSSLKYKTDVQDATHGLAEVMQLRPVTYKGKTDGDTVFGGLIAEEVDAVGLTEFVQYAADGSPDALAYGNMVSVLVKAIQEQQAIIDSLKARLDAANL